MRFISKLRLSLAALLLILGILVTYAKEGKNNEYEQIKRAIYLQIHTELETGKISLEEAQLLWRKKIKHLKKEEAN